MHHLYWSSVEWKAINSRALDPDEVGLSRSGLQQQVTQISLGDTLRVGIPSKTLQCLFSRFYLLDKEAQSQITSVSSRSARFAVIFFPSSICSNFWSCRNKTSHSTINQWIIKINCCKLWWAALLGEKWMDSSKISGLQALGKLHFQSYNALLYTSSTINASLHKYSCLYGLSRSENDLITETENIRACANVSHDNISYIQLQNGTYSVNMKIIITSQLVLNNRLNLSSFPVMYSHIRCFSSFLTPAIRLVRNEGPWNSKFDWYLQSSGCLTVLKRGWDWRTPTMLSLASLTSTFSS